MKMKRTIVLLFSYVLSKFLVNEDDSDEEMKMMKSTSKKVPINIHNTEEDVSNPKRNKSMSSGNRSVSSGERHIREMEVEGDESFSGKKKKARRISGNADMSINSNTNDNGILLD